MSRALRGLPAAALIALSFPSSAFAIEAAVSPFAAVGVDGEVAFNVTSAFSSELEFRIEYDWVEQLSDPPTGMSAKCLSSTSCLKTAGKAAGKNHFIGGNVSAVGDMLEVEVVLFDVDKGTLVRRKTFNTTEAGLVGDASSFVNELLTGASHEDATAAASVADSSEFLDDGDDWDFDDSYEVSSTIPLPSNSGKSLDDFDDPLEYEAELARERAEEERARQEEEDRLRREEEARLAAARAAEEERLRREEEERLRREEEARLAAARAAAEEEERRRRDEEAAAAAAAAAAMTFDEDEMDLDSISFGSAADEITVDDISFGSSASSIVIEDDDPYVADSRSGYDEVDLDDWSDFDDGADDWEEDDYDRTSGGYLDLDAEPEEETSSSRRSSGTDRSSRSTDRSSRSSSSSSISSSKSSGEGLGFQIAARGGVSRYQSFGFITYGAEIGIPVADKVAVRVGLEGFSTEREIPPALRTDANEETRWNTILPFNGGVAFYPITSGTFRPYIGGDITLTPYTPEFDMSPGVRGRAGADLMFSDSFGLNANLALGFWYGKEFAQIQEGLSNSGLVPQASAGTVIVF